MRNCAAVLTLAFAVSAFGAEPSMDDARLNALTAILSTALPTGLPVNLIVDHLVGSYSTPSALPDVITTAAGAGGRHRAVKPPSGAPVVTPPAGSDCVNVPLITPGTVATYVQSPNPNPLNITSTLTYTYAVSNSSQQIFNVHAVSSSGGGALGTTDVHVELTVAPASTGGVALLAASKMKVELNVSLGGMPLVGTFDTTFSPAFPSSPASTWCKGATWPIAATTWSGTASAGGQSQPFSLPVPAATGQILARETVTVPYGTRDTFKLNDYLGSFMNQLQQQPPTIGWVDVQRGVYVQWQMNDAAGNATMTKLTTLTP